jgi:Mg2+/citrate symporter
MYAMEQLHTAFLMATTCGLSPFIIFRSIFKQDPLRDTGVLLIFKALYFSIGYNILARITKQIIKPIVKPVIFYVVRQYDEIWNANDLTDPMANLYMVIFSSRLPIYMRLSFIPGIIIAMIKSTLHSVAKVLRNIGDRFKGTRSSGPLPE